MRHEEKEVEVDLQLHLQHQHPVRWGDHFLPQNRKATQDGPKMVRMLTQLDSMTKVSGFGEDASPWVSLSPRVNPRKSILSHSETSAPVSNSFS